MAVTPFLNNAATVLVMAPIAASFAGKLGYNPDAFLMAVAIGAARRLVVTGSLATRGLEKPLSCASVKEAAFSTGSAIMAEMGASSSASLLTKDVLAPFSKSLRTR
jgi:hypothetical protein